MKKFYAKRKELMELLTSFVDRAEEALFNGENIEETLEYIGLKSDEMLMKL
ncbi:hypothetical protein JTZ62_04960 [Mammaliicoccus sciuri]|uniref:hypothetical protein n=1 Tax=Mammaliicoccus sciuri TaxID=1296 RepID=UPI0019D3BBB6|nr:hypothetical protein [Mammaliicoccus sciuri]QSN68510.1 hypothetical protein JTZ62_04960 [Mammaliicoccus sciuri]UIU23251.1 hypothetical protein LLZ87_04975 [Mammaliicoccus sciuri]UIU26157.1 hypothetical protein LLZ92_04975 [Mammaliicoccus sciuri]